MSSPLVLNVNLKDDRQRFLQQVSKKQFRTVYHNTNTRGYHKWTNNIAKYWNFEVLFFDNFRKSSQSDVISRLRLRWMCP